MAVSGRDISLIFKLVADSSQARNEFTAFQSALNGNIGSLVGLFKRLATESNSSIAGAAQSFKILEGALLSFTADLSEVPKLARQFTQAINVAAAGNETLQKTFRSLGVDINQALKSPQQGLAQFLSGFGRLSTEAEKVAAAEAVFLTTTGGIVPALDAAAAGMASFAAAEGTATTGAVALDTALLPVTITIAAVVAAVAAVAVVAGGFFSLAKGAAEADTKIKELSDKTGVSVRNISILTAAAKENSIGFDVVSRSIDQFVTRLDDAARSSGKTEGALAFKKLGVEGKESLRDVNSTLETVIASLNKTSNASVRYADTQRVFGLRNEQAATIIKTLGGSLDDYGKRLDTVGVVTDAQASASKSFTTSLNRLAAATSGVAINIGRELIPLFQPMIDLTKTVVQIFGDLLVSALRACAPVITNIGRGIDVLNAALRASPLFVAVLGAALGDAVLLFARTATVIGNTAKVLVAFATGNFALAAESAGKVASGVSGLFDGIGDSTRKALEKAKKATADNLKEILANRKKFDEASKGGNVDLPQKEKTSKEKEALEDDLRRLRRQEQAADREAQAEIAAARRAFEFRQITIEQLEQLVIAAENKMLDAKKATFTAERELVRQALKDETLKANTAQEKENARKRSNDKLAEIDERQATSEQKAASTILKAQDDTRKTLIQIFDQAANAKAKRQEEESRREIELVKQAASNRLITEETAARKIGEIEAKIFNQRKLALIADITLTQQNSLEHQKAVDELAQLEQKRAEEVEDSQRRILEAQRRDLANLQAFLQERNKLLENLARTRVDELQRQADDLTSKAQTRPALRGQAIDAQFVAQQEAESLRRAQNIAQIEADRIAAENAATSNAQKEEAQKLSNQRIEAEEQRHRQALAEITRNQRIATEANDPTSARSLFGADFADILAETGSRFDAFAGTALKTFTSLSEGAGNFGTIATGAIASFGKGIGSLVSNFVLLGTTGPQALRKMTASVLSEVAAQAAVKAVFELAAGFASLFFNPSEAASHFTAAALFGSVAGVTAGIGRAVAGDSFSQGNQSQGAGAFGGQSRNPQDSQFTFGDVRGKLGQNAEDNFSKIGKGFFGESLERLREEVARQGEESRQVALRQIEATGKHADAAEALVSRINSIPPEDVLSVAVDRAPEHIGRGLDAATSSNSDITRNLALKLGVG